MASDDWGKFVCFSVLFCLTGALAPGETTPTGYAGSNACKTCHADIWFHFNKNPHFKSIASGKEPPERTGCEGCHGPAEAHIAAGGGRKTIPRAFTIMKPQEVIEACLTCHARDLQRANIRRSEHTRHDVACTSCHSNHHPATPKNLLAKKQTELCYACHDSVRAQFQMQFKHKVNEGLIQCSDCHNPHGTQAPTWGMASRPRMVAQALNNEMPCMKCHADKRGPFMFEHPAVRVGACTACHMPHGSMNAKLLTRPVVFTLCLECHTGAGPFDTNRRGIGLEDNSHNLLDPRYQKCTVCHARIHGSNADRTFFR